MDIKEMQKKRAERNIKLANMILEAFKNKHPNNPYETEPFEKCFWIFFEAIHYYFGFIDVQGLADDCMFDSHQEAVAELEYFFETLARIRLLYKYEWIIDSEEGKIKNSVTFESGVIEKFAHSTLGDGEESFTVLCPGNTSFNADDKLFDKYINHLTVLV